MNQNPVKKTRIQLADYDYEQDIDFRLLMAELSVFEVDVIHEILHSSLKIPLSQLQNDLNVDREKLESALQKLAALKLLKVEGDEIQVSKEMRKYYETQIDKFDDDFRADMEFLRALLGKVPIHVLPTWYMIPRTSDDIFQSIIEKFLLTPKLFQRYLNELIFDDPILNQIKDDVYSSPNLKIYSRDILKKYDLTREQLEEYMLLLEFNLVCCLSYNQVDDRWEEVVTPFYEWKQFQQFMENSTPKTIENDEAIRRTHRHDFGFVQDVTRLLLGAQDKEVKLEDSLLSGEDIKEFLPEHDPITVSKEYISDLIQNCLEMKFAKFEDGILVPLESANDWIKKPIQEQAMTLYRFTSGQLPDRDTRAIAKSLKRVKDRGWIYFEDFLKGFTGEIGESEPVMLARMGRRWKYKIPEYSEEERDIIRKAILERLFHSGIVATGIHQGKLCFCITPFGQSTLD